MALAFDAASGAQGVFVNTISWSHTCSGSDRILFVTMEFSLIPGMSVTSVTYNGVAMTSLHATIVAGNGVRTTTYCLVNPASGAHNIVINTDNAGDILDCNAASYTGADQQVPTIMQVDTTGANPSTTSVTTVDDNSWCILMGSGGQTAGTNSTQRGASHAQGGCLYDSNGPVSPAGSFSMTISGASNCGLLMVAFSPVPPGTPVAITATQGQTATLTMATLRPIAITATQESTGYLIVQQVYAPTEIDDHTQIAAITGLRPQPYRLDLGSIGSADELNRRLPEIVSNADFMFQVLFEDLKRVNDALGTGTALGVDTVQNDVNVTGLITGSTIALGWTGLLAVPRGGTGRSSVTAFAVICGGTTSFGALQSVVGTGTAGQVLTSNGPGALPTWQ